MAYFPGLIEEPTERNAGLRRPMRFAVARLSFASGSSARAMSRNLVAVRSIRDPRTLVAGAGLQRVSKLGAIEAEGTSLMSAFHQLGQVLLDDPLDG
jgi:hypothetical protein